MTVDPRDYSGLKMKLSGFLKPGEQLYRNVLLDRLYATIPKDGEVKILIYNAELAPGGYTNWHCHNGPTFFVALQGLFEAHFREPGIVVKARAGEVYSEPIGKFHRGYNPHPELAYHCIGFQLTPPNLEHVTNEGEIT